MLKSFSVIIIICSILLSGGCSPDPVIRDEPVKIILDTDMGSDCDDAGALALLHRYADLGLAKIRKIGKTGYYLSPINSN